DKWYHEREPSDVKDDDASDDPSSSGIARPNGLALPAPASAALVSNGEAGGGAQLEKSFYKPTVIWAAFASLVVLGVFIALAIRWYPAVIFLPRGTMPVDGKMRLFVRP